MVQRHSAVPEPGWHERFDPLALLIIDILEGFCVQFAQSACVGEEDRGNAGQWPRTESAGKEQCPNEHINRTQEVKEALDELIEETVWRYVSCSKERQRKGKYGCEQRTDEGHDNGLHQLDPDIPMLPFRIIEEIVDSQHEV